ncbi:SapC family protein [Alteromonas sp. P256]|uniref:SapC family protein n=1 Tax=Alteromonas sp. P256 TaxID=3117399 RepID=UPI002FE12B42
MPNFEVLTADKHSDVRVDEDKLAKTFANFHLVNVEIKEAVQASSEYPLFFSKVSNQQRWTISALCGFAPKENVFETQGTWLAHVTPLSLRTLPFTLSFESDPTTPETLLDMDSPAVAKNNTGKDRGDALFLSSGRPTAYLDNKQKLLKERVDAMQQTASLLSELAELALIQPTDLLIEYADKTQQRVGGLAMLNEERLQQLSPETLSALNRKGVLSVLFNILGSVFQVNRVIRLHNTKFPTRLISNVKFEISKP